MLTQQTYVKLKRYKKMKLIKSFGYAWNGIKTTFTSQTNFKIHLLAAIITIVLGFVLNIAAIEWVIIIFCIALVLTMEMINTAVEKLCDVVHKDTHPIIKMVKDIAAGAVLVVAANSLIVGGVIFLPKIIVYFKLV
jgi:diacylglycerol kinase